MTTFQFTLPPFEGTHASHTLRGRPYACVDERQKEKMSLCHQSFFLAMSGEPLRENPHETLCEEGIGFPLLPLNLPDFMGKSTRKLNLFQCIRQPLLSWCFPLLCLFMTLVGYYTYILISNSSLKQIQKQLINFI